MTRQELVAFEKQLGERGYRKCPSHLRAEYAWFKSFGRDRNKYDDERSMYQIGFHVYDFSPYADRESWFKEQPYTVSPEVGISRTIDERIGVSLSHASLGLNVESIEAFAEEMMEFVNRSIEPPKK